MVDYSKISIKSLNCDKCSLKHLKDDCNGEPKCVWVPNNKSNSGTCMDKCKARITKGECEQYHEWNRTRFTPVIYDYDGSDNRCQWHPHPHSVDDTPDSIDGDCRAKSEYVTTTTTTPAGGGTPTTTTTTENSYCFEPCAPGASTCTSGTCKNFIEGNYCVPNDRNTLGEIYCGHNYSGHHKGCNNNTTDADCTGSCELYRDPKYYDFPSTTPEQDKGICVSDGIVTYDLTTGKSQGLLMTDEQCNNITTSMECINYTGKGCLWQPYSKYCNPVIDKSTEETLFNSCEKITGHVPSNYDVNMLEEEHKNVSEYRDRDNIKYPYQTSKYLCDVCHIRDQDLDTMKEISTEAVSGGSGATEAANKLKYFMIKKFVDFGDTLSSRSTTVSVTPQQYCERELDDQHEQFKACEWIPDTSISKGGKCQSICSKHSPIDATTTNSMELKAHKDQCISDKWHPTSPGAQVEFPKLITGSEASDDYYNDRFCTWDGFECHNSIPCKFAQQTRCEDLGYEWYQGSALDIMNQNNINMGIPLDLSTSYPIVRKGDGKPVEGDIEGICIYPNAEPDVGFHETPADYIINTEYIGHQAVIIKYREYGTGWWEDMSCMRKKENLSAGDITDTKNDKASTSYFLGERVILVPFEIRQGDKCSDVKDAINGQLQSYQYYTYNGEWLVWAADVISAIDRSYNSTIDEDTVSSDAALLKYIKHYGYLYYTSNNLSDFRTISYNVEVAERKRLNAIYDMRGSVELLPVVNDQAALQITSFDISTITGSMTFEVSTPSGIIDNTLFQFVEFITPDIFGISSSTLSRDQKEDNYKKLNNKLVLTTLSKYSYYVTNLGRHSRSLLPDNILQGYGTLYENKNVVHISGSVEKKIFDSNGFPSSSGSTTDVNNPDNREIMNSRDKQYDIRDPILNNGGTNANDNLKKLMKLFYAPATSTTQPPTHYDYLEEELNTWAAYKEYTNFNVFSQPIINMGKEFKHKMDYTYDNGTKRKVCGGSIESYKHFKKIFDDNPALYPLGAGETPASYIIPEGIRDGPRYQYVHLRDTNPMLRLFSRYFKEGNGIIFNSDYFTVLAGSNSQPANYEGGTATRQFDMGYDGNNAAQHASLTTYGDIVNSGDIRKAVLWSISRNTPPFWGNLSFNRGVFNGDLNQLYRLGCNFNLFPQGASVGSADDPSNFSSTGSQSFKFGLSETSLIKPFCEASTNESDQRIYWKRILSYTGGNKREIQLSRNVPKQNYDEYFRLLTDSNNYNLLTQTNPGTGAYTSTQMHYMGVSKDFLLGKIKALWPLISLSKREYIIRSLLDWKRRSNTTPRDSAAASDNTIPACPVFMNELPGKYNEINNLKINEIVDYFNDTLPSPGTASRNWESIQSLLLDIPRHDQKANRGYCRTNMYKFSDDHSLGNSISNYLIAGGGGAANPTTVQGAGVKGTGNGGWLGGPDYSQTGGKFNHAWQDSHNVGKWTAEGLERDDPYGNIDYDGGDPGYKYIWAQTKSEADNIIGGDCNNPAASQALHDCTYDSNGDTPDPRCTVGDVAGRAARFNFCCGIDRIPDCRRISSGMAGVVDGVLPSTHLFPSNVDVISYHTSAIFKSGNSGDKATSTVITNNLSEMDIKPDSFDRNIASLYKLSHISHPNYVKQQNGSWKTDDASIILPWGIAASGSDTTAIPPRIDENAMWGALNTEYTSNTQILDYLVYPEDNTSENPTYSNRIADWPLQSSNPTTIRNADDRLRAWCMSDNVSLNTNFYLDNSASTTNGNIYGHKNDKIDPDNTESQMGILYSNWVTKRNSTADANNQVSGDDYNSLPTNFDKTEFFDRIKNTNAHKYPMICEPWLLKSTLEDDKLAYYTNNIIQWEGMEADGTPFNPLNVRHYDEDLTMRPNVDSTTGSTAFYTANSHYPDQTKIKGISTSSDPNNSGVYNPYPWSGGEDGGAINDSNVSTGSGNTGVFGSANSSLTTATFESGLIGGINKSSLVGTTNDKNYFFNMLYPLSITSAKPRELKIYVNITPNNDMFDPYGPILLAGIYADGYQLHAGVDTRLGGPYRKSHHKTCPTTSDSPDKHENFDKINIFYFEDFLITSAAGSTPATTADIALTGNNNNTSILNQYDYAPSDGTETEEQKSYYYWLHPGIDEMISRNSSIVTINHSHNKANKHVKYFKSVYELLNKQISSPSAITIASITNDPALNEGLALPDTNTSMCNSSETHVFKRDVSLTQGGGGASAVAPYDRLTSSKLLGYRFVIDNIIRTNKSQYGMAYDIKGIGQNIFFNLKQTINYPGGITKNNNKNLLYYPRTYEDEHFPAQLSYTKSVNLTFFGNGYNTSYTPPANPTCDHDNHPDACNTAGTESTNCCTPHSAGVPLNVLNGTDINKYAFNNYSDNEIIPPDTRPTYYNIEMVFPSTGQNVDTCKSLIESKLSSCGSPAFWTDTAYPDHKDKCNACFQSSDTAFTSLCGEYTNYIVGLTPNNGKDSNLTTLDPASTDTSDQTKQKAKDAGVCGILNYIRAKELPWSYMGVTHMPQGFGQNLPDTSPYDTTARNCNKLITNNVVGAKDIKYTTIQHAGSSETAAGEVDHATFFHPARSGQSNVFQDEHPTLGDTAFGCMRNDLSLMTDDQIKLSCNTNLSTPVERDKHVIINFIINHDTTGELNTSHRTKLAIMTEEELLNKALSLGVSLEQINEYTRPKLLTKTRDVLMPNLCEDGVNYCDDNHPCPNIPTMASNRCGLYEEWNDLQKYYYNITPPNDKNNFTTNRQWDFVGCGIDLNYNDNTSGEIICKDKYPGLCEKNIDKCKSKNDAVREAIMLDCPETCQVQYRNLDEFKGKQIGELSICTSRGRCKWSHDQDPSNLLPLCEENTVRELGTVQKCHNYNSLTEGPQAGSCDLRNHPETIDSQICKQQRCESMAGCEYTPQSTPYCRLESSVDPNITRQIDCPSGGRWVGASSTGGQCIMPERDLSASDMQSTPQTFDSDCNLLGGNVIGGTQESCEYHPDLPYSGEDPCTHVVDLDELTTDEQARYLYIPVNGVDIHVDSIVPEVLDGETGTHPHYIKIILNNRLNASTIQNFGNITGFNSATGEIYPRDKYVYIDNNSNHIESVCSQYLVGKSRIVQIKNIGSGTENTEIIIGGPNKSYILPRSPNNPSVIDIGNTDTYFACQFRGIYDLDQYYTNNPNSASQTNTQTPEQRKQSACLNNPKGACNYERGTETCVSCTLYRDEFSCFGGDNPNDYSRCGWGSIEDMCGVIGDMAECKKMHLDGCEWDPAEEKCSLNKLTNTNGTPLIEKVGCVKCDDIKHRNTCNSMKNCFWDRVTNLDGDNIGECRACTSIGDPDGNGVGGVNGAEWSDSTGIKSGRENTIKACDDFELTEGQCEFRDPNTKVTGIDVIFSSHLWENEKTFLETVWKALTGQDTHVADDIKDCDTGDICKCSYSRPYPLFPDWIIHNLYFILVMAPFAIYFMYAWWKVLVSPGIYTNELKKIDDDGLVVLSRTIGDAKKATKDTKSIIGGGENDGLDELLDKFRKVLDDYKDNGSSSDTGPTKLFENTRKWFSDKASWISSKKKNVRSISNKISPIAEMGYFNFKGEFAQTKWTYAFDKNVEIKEVLLGGIIPETYKDMGPGQIFEVLFSNLIPNTDITDDKKVDWGGWLAKVLQNWHNIEGKGKYIKAAFHIFTLFMRPAIFLKIIYLILALPFTIIQLLANNVRLSILNRISRLIFMLARWLWPTIELGLSDAVSGPGALLKIIFKAVLSIIIFVLGVALAIFGNLALIILGFSVLMNILEYGVTPNHNYISTAETNVFVPDPADKNKLVKAAVWPEVIYRDEWDDMIKDPISDAVIQQREELLPHIIEGDPLDEDNITDAYKLAYLTITPDSLNWTKYFRSIGKTYNNFINRVGDKFIYRFILLPILIFGYIGVINNEVIQPYYESNSGSFDIKSFFALTFIFALILGLTHAYMTPLDTKDDEYDGVESKCPETPTPFPIPLGNVEVNYPQFCFGDSDKDDKNECPYGCYYVGDGSDTPKKCKDNRSVFSLGKYIGSEPEPKMNIPYPTTLGMELPNDWTTGGPANKHYKCPPSSRFISKQPYDYFCSTTAKRCRATDETKYITDNEELADEYCEMLYRKNNYNDTKCNNNFSGAGETYPDGTQGPKGPIEEIGVGIHCRLETPYEGYKKKYNCPFPLPAAENTFFSEQGDTRAPVSLLQWGYDRIQHPERQQTCTASCSSPGNCTSAEQNDLDICQSVVMNESSREDNKNKCENTPTSTIPCEYFPQNVPLQTSMQNQERYLIVNQQFGENLFS